MTRRPFQEPARVIADTSLTDGVVIAEQKLQGLWSEASSLTHIGAEVSGVAEREAVVGASFRLGIASRDDCSTDRELSDQQQFAFLGYSREYLRAQVLNENPDSDNSLPSEFLQRSRFRPTVDTVFEEGEEESGDELHILENVTDLTRSLIPTEYFKSSRKFRKLSRNMSSRARPGLGSLRKRLSGRLAKSATEEPAPSNGDSRSVSPSQARKSRGGSGSPPGSPKRRSHSQVESPTKSPGRKGRGSFRRTQSEEEDPPAPPPGSPGKQSRGREARPGVFQRLRERSRSRSRSASRRNLASEDRKEMLVAVTSCRSDGYYNQKAPGSTSKLPRKAPTNLKLFHELAVGVKDAYAAVGATPRKPNEDDQKMMDEQEFHGRLVLWDFVGNLDFVSVAIDERGS